MLWVCKDCTARYSVGARRCPQCGATEYYEQGADDAAEHARQAESAPESNEAQGADDGNETPPAEASKPKRARS